MQSHPRIPLSKRLRLYLRFSRPFIAVNLFINIASIWLLLKYGLSYFAILLIYKILAAAIIIYIVSQLDRKKFYYLENMGLGKKELWAGSLGIDFGIWLLLCIAALCI